MHGTYMHVRATALSYLQRSRTGRNLSQAECSFTHDQRAGDLLLLSATFLDPFGEARVELLQLYRTAECELLGVLASRFAKNKKSTLTKTKQRARAS